MAKKHKKGKPKKQPRSKTRPEPPNSNGIVFHKQLIPAAISLAVLYIYFSIPNYHWWLTQRIFNYYREMSHQLETMEVDKRIAERQRYDYFIPKLIHDQTPDTAIILLPSRDYVRENFSERIFQWCHAAWNYYYFGPRKYMNFNPGGEQKFSKTTYAIICNPLAGEELTDQEKLLLANSKPLIRPTKNERGETVSIRLVTINSPETLKAVFDEYEGKS